VVALRLLQRCCEGLALALAERVTQLNLPQLEALSEALWEFRETADLEQWRATHARE